MSQDQIREVGKALLPYLRNDLTDAELGMAAHDAVAALNRVAGIDRLLAEVHEANAACDAQVRECNHLRAEKERLLSDKIALHSQLEEIRRVIDRWRPKDE